MLVRGHLAGHEDEPKEHHSRTEDGYVFQRLLENDIQVAMCAGLVGVSHPPEVKPVRVDLKTSAVRPAIRNPNIPT